MRIALASWNRKKFGGAENYLASVIPGLARAGQELAHLCEVALPVERAAIGLPPGSPIWCRADQGIDRILGQLIAWTPEVIFCHGLRDPELEAALTRIAPVVFFAHDYYGSCISGTKSFAFPRTRPCGQSFDWRCLGRYYPRRCGGLSPSTLWRLYRRERRHLDLLRNYAAIIVGSEHMRRELLRQGLAPDAVRMLAQVVAEQGGGPLARDAGAAQISAVSADQEWRLLFAGRMVELKGGEVLLRAMPMVAAALPRPLRLIMAGDGPARPRWVKLAQRLSASCGNVAVDFTGWLNDAALAEVVVRSHLVVMPSLWPEPFGRVGPEAALAGVPTVAFAVGGIPEWLVDGENGHLAPGNPPTAAGLAGAIVRALADPAHRAELGRHARERIRRTSLEGHVVQLIEVFEEARVRGRAAEAAGHPRRAVVAAGGGAR